MDTYVVNCKLYQEESNKEKNLYINLENTMSVGVSVHSRVEYHRLTIKS